MVELYVKKWTNGPNLGCNVGGNRCDAKAT
jgi:hypothetical protein